jgi:hypothetical protein
MSESLVQDTLSVAEKTIRQTADKHDSSNIWFWIAIGEFAIILGFLFYSRLKRKRNAKQSFKDESIAQDVDFDNIINSSFHSNELYNILKVKCHPDKFPTDSELNAIANKLFQEITKNKTNIKKLEDLKIEAQKKLSINF